MVLEIIFALASLLNSLFDHSCALNATFGSVYDTSDAISLQALNSLLVKDSLERPCLLVLYGLPLDHIQVIANRLDLGHPSFVGIFVFNQVNMDAWQWHGRARCFIGLAQMSKLHGLQELLADLPHRRLILLRGSLEVTISNKENRELVAVDRRHHPPIIIQARPGKDPSLLFSCRRPNRSLPVVTKVDLFSSAMKSWKFNQNICEECLERFCNNGHNEMYGKNVVASAFGLYPRVVLQRHDGKLKMTGLVLDLTNVLAKSVGFKPRYVLTRTWGRMLPNGTLFGTRGNVMSGHSDLGLEIQVIYPRGPGASKTEGNMTNTNFWTIRIFNFLTLKPKMKAQWKNITLPLDKNSWLAVLLSLISVSTTLCLISYYENKTVKPLMQRYMDMLVLSFGIMWQEYKPDWNRYHHGKVFQSGITRGSLMRIHWVILAFLMLEFYRCNLKASLTIRSYEPNIHNIQEALDRDMAVHMQDLIVQQFKAFPDEQTLHILKQVYEKGSVIPASPKLVTDTQNAVLEKGGVGYFYDELMARGKQMYHQRGEEYPLTFMAQKYSTNYDGLILPYMSPRLHIINPVIRRIYESGIVFRLYGKYKLDMAHQKEEADAKLENEKLTLSHYIIPLVVMIIGGLSGVLIFLFKLCIRPNMTKFHAYEMYDGL